MKSSTRYLLVCPLLAGLAVSSCLKLEVSPLQELGPLVASVPTTAPTTAQYRFANASSGTARDTLQIYTSLTCAPLGVLAGTTQTVARGSGPTAYFAIAPGFYATGDTGGTYCAAFSPVAGQTYTITYNKSPTWQAPSISSP